MTYSYRTREMNAKEKQLQKEYCYYEDKIRTLLKVVGEQFILWLFLMLLVYAVLETIYATIKVMSLILMLIVYLFISVLGAVVRYNKERKVVLAMQNQSKPIYEEFRRGKAESCEIHIVAADKLEEKEDEGPTYILNIGDNNLIILCEHGKIKDDTFTPGNVAEVVRLPESKRVIAAYWSGSPVKISKTIEVQYLNSLYEKWIEGDIIKGAIE
jgi:hypothetical protein